MSSSSYPRTEQMSVGPDNNQNGNIQEKDWSYKLGDCHDACFLSTKTFICPCVTYGENRSNITKKNNNIICSILYCFFCPCILGALSRYDVRRKYNIKGSLGVHIVFVVAAGKFLILLISLFIFYLLTNKCTLALFKNLERSKII
ncbi:hypothetical protein RhiirC2_853444 [Rhizophagus irregularis]|uniref:Uncharacterized protein n=1 Tax=Rhizophagus irregularis TaxID=588596 RepID=A0A2N1MVJ2_9GLOM|nr:hypothetical protein RhiirC2_853444 [Rhizophagus irregularis]